MGRKGGITNPPSMIAARPSYKGNFPMVFTVKGVSGLCMVSCWKLESRESSVYCLLFTS